MDDTSIHDSCITDGEVSDALHPSKFEFEHINKVQRFSEDLQKAIQTSYPRPVQSYTAVDVLLLRWTDDDLGVQVELDQLRTTFERQFNFATEQWNIPNQDPTRALEAKIWDFRKDHQSERELLIVYYAGHGEYSRSGQSEWAANKRLDSPSLTWSSVQTLLGNAVPHVLIILDCCYAANAASYTIGGTTKELLAACGRENLTTGVGDRSFTSALIDELQAFGSNPFTVAMLHTRLVTMRWRLRFTPIYALLSKHGGDSIDLSRLPSTKRSRPPTVTEADENSMPLDDPMDLSSSDESNLSLSLHPSSR